MGATLFFDQFSVRVFVPNIPLFFRVAESSENLHHFFRRSLPIGSGLNGHNVCFSRFRDLTKSLVSDPKFDLFVSTPEITFSSRPKMKGVHSPTDRGYTLPPNIVQYTPLFIISGQWSDPVDVWQLRTKALRRRAPLDRP